MRKVETGRFYGTKSVKEADDGHDNRTALSALLALVDADGTWPYLRSLVVNASTLLTTSYCRLNTQHDLSNSVSKTPIHLIPSFPIIQYLSDTARLSTKHTNMFNLKSYIYTLRFDPP